MRHLPGDATAARLPQHPEAHMSVFDWVSGRVFKFVHGNNLVYNTCWEDPRLDRVALQIGQEDEVLVITSAGCNALDYALCGPRRVHAVDMNPRQNALLDLKLAGIKTLEHEDFFRIFGYGFHPEAKKLYRQKMRPALPAWSAAYWDRWIKFFHTPGRPFYYRGTSGYFARMIRIYTDRVIRVRPYMDALLEAKTLNEQREIYERHLKEKFWSRPMKFAMNRDTTLSMVGVPKAQRKQVEQQYDGGVVKFVQDCVETVFCKLPIADNYFWRVYMKGEYSRNCCPEYLKQENFEKLKDGLAERVKTYTNSVQGFLESHRQPISRFVLLDHMDWLSDKFFPLLELEWQAIMNRSAPNSRIIWRSGGLKTDFLDRVRVNVRGTHRRLPDLLEYQRELAAELHEQDRVHTYGSFYIANLAA
jgi:S-adenosylmethionine-diacylglycerol 3-amino-3-carboxypropyl transferase